MRKSSFLWLSIVTTLVLIHVGIAQDKNQKPKRAVEKWAKEAKKRNGDKENLRINNFIMQRLDPLLKHIGENMSQRYELDETTVNNFQQHVRESVKTQLNQEKHVTGTTWDNGQGFLQETKFDKKFVAEIKDATKKGKITGQQADQKIAEAKKLWEANKRMEKEFWVKRDTMRNAAEEGGIKMLELLLSQTDFKAALTKHLNEEQLQDYLDLTQKRRKLAQQAITRQLTANLDQQLSLTTDQRQKVEQLLDMVNSFKKQLATGMKTELTPIEMLVEIDSQESVNMIHRLKVPIDGILSKSQSEIWKLLAPSRKIKAPREEKFDKAEAEIMEAVKAGKIDKREAGVLLKDLKRRPRGKAEAENSNSEFEKRAKLMAEAKLAAYTEQLGSLDDRASRRLSLVTKGVVEQHLEAQPEDPDERHKKAEAEIIKAVKAGKINRREVGAKLEALKKELWQEEKEWVTENEYKHKSNTEITNHPLYQQTIKDVLSDKAFARYKALQAERQAFRLQATSDLVVASLDTHLLLDESQRQHFEDTVAQLSTSGNIFTKLFEQLDNSEVLNSWQQARLDEFKWFDKDKEGWLGQDKKK
ncbi:MAG: hypothetical protein VX901_13880 [Candidatus Poribacteria bacterium]|nr:hypothetical protein [Candidatus Poribacteria bacterium]